MNLEIYNTLCSYGVETNKEGIESNLQLETDNSITHLPILLSVSMFLDQLAGYSRDSPYQE